MNFVKKYIDYVVRFIILLFLFNTVVVFVGLLISHPAMNFLDFTKIFSCSTNECDVYSRFGVMGDFFGGFLNPIISLVSAILIYYTYKNQKYVNNLNMEFIKKQSNQNKKDKVNEMFSMMLSQFLAIKSKVDDEITDEVFEKVFRNKDYYSNTCGLRHSKIEMMRYNDKIGHYFRMLYQILKFLSKSVDDKDITIDEAKRLSNILRSLINSKQTQLLAVNCFCLNNQSDIYWDYKGYIEQFSMLEHMSFSNSKNDRIYYNLLDSYFYFESKAFDKNEFIFKIRNNLFFKDFCEKRSEKLKFLDCFLEPVMN